MNKKYKKTKVGTTLVEVLVYMALMGIVFAGIYGVFIASLRYYRTAEATARLQQNALIALSSITSDMSETKSSSISVNPSSPQGISFASPKKIPDGTYNIDTSTGEIYFQKWICYYLDENTGDLIRKEVEINNPTTSPGTMQVPLLVQEDSPYRKVVARGIQLLEIDSADAPTYSITLTADQTTDTTKQNKIIVKTDVFVRN